ncbi:uncharacterized protein LOC117173010 isoform X2 [Belonocnema kinseyi]|uniref:uncharacterized protein LOC117173010 isoform X2 n=1 Tax=Belonocnema kinseyi TaxID=2817044 RepID=UPI00143D607F|nr:uncharacterized protein LOC117173010 isoform X2 [Belonocnema kinseyi]
MVWCCIETCKMQSMRGDGVSFSRIPAVVGQCNKKYKTTYSAQNYRKSDNLSRKGTDFIKLSEKRQRAWIRAIKRGKLTDTQIKNLRVCSNHFHSGRPAELYDIKNPDWVPSKNLGNAVDTASKRPSTLEWRERQRKKVTIAESIDTDDHLEDDIVIDEIKVEIEEKTGTASQTDVLGTEIDRLREELRLAKEEIAELKKRQHKSALPEESFPNDDLKTLYFTGIDIPDLPRVICTPHIRAVIRSHSDEISRT